MKGCFHVYDSNGVLKVLPKKDYKHSRPVNKDCYKFIIKNRAKHFFKRSSNKDLRINPKFGVSIITSTIRKNSMHNIFTNYKNQLYNHKELIVILNKNNMNKDKWIEESRPYKNIRIFKLDEKKSLGECLNYAVSKAKFNYITKFDDDNYYGPSFIPHLMKDFKITNADIVGKLSYYVFFADSNILAINFPRHENKYVDIVSGSALIFPKRIFNFIQYPHINLGEDTYFLKKCIENNLKLYSSDRFNYVCIRQSNLNFHTWKISQKSLLQNCNIVKFTNGFKKYVDI